MPSNKSVLGVGRLLAVCCLFLVIPGTRAVKAQSPAEDLAAPPSVVSRPASAPAEARQATAVTAPSPVAPRIDLTINNPSLRQIPLAIPDFLSTPGSDMAASSAREAAKLTADTLLFTGLFKLLPKESYLVKLKGATDQDVKYADWSAIGAELLITGEVESDGKTWRLSLRLFDPINGRMVFGRAYPNYTDVRGPVMKFCAEVMRHLTGSEGVFNTKLAFVSTGPGHKEIYVCDFDGQNAVQVTHGSRIALSPDWSSDGRYIAYTTYRDRAPHIGILDRRSNKTQVVAHSSMDITPRWRPGSFELAATLSVTRDPEIYTLTGDGKIIKRITD